MGEKNEVPKGVPINESYDLLQKSMNNLNIQQSSGSTPPELYPSVNGQAPVQPQAEPPQPTNQESGEASSPADLSD